MSAQTIDVQNAGFEAIGRACFEVVHEINNQLSVVTGYSELLLHRDEPPKREELEQIARAGHRAGELAQQVLCLGRGEHGPPTCQNLSDLVQRMAPMLQLIAGKNATLVTKLHEEPLAVLVHRGDVEHVLLNLVTNARDALDSKGTIRIETFKKRHELSGAAPAGQYCVLSVSDSGRGMSPPVQARAFDPFFTTKPPGKGTGIGMTIVQNALERSNGFARLHSTVGQGTTIETCWPLHAE